jgi:hypothetical protein
MEEIFTVIKNSSKKEGEDIVQEIADRVGFERDPEEQKDSPVEED